MPHECHKPLFALIVEMGSLAFWTARAITFRGSDVRLRSDMVASFSRLTLVQFKLTPDSVRPLPCVDTKKIELLRVQPRTLGHLNYAG